jgi:hypothetical protein
MNSLFCSYDLGIENTYIITVKNHKTSEELSKRCQLSCLNVSMPYQVWDAFDGTGDSIIVPEHSKNETIVNSIKITDHYMTRGEVACALSHISLWVRCAVIDKPIVILEHDAVMVKKFDTFDAFNSIIYLGGVEWAKQNWPVCPGIPPHASEGPNYHFICRAHAYAIDPAMARNLLSHVLKMGICAPLDIIMRTDLFNVTHYGLFAYDDSPNRNNDTTIKARPQEGRSTLRNDKLKI